MKVLEAPMYGISPDAMIAAASHVEREYGYGYRIAIALTATRAAVFEVSHFDGSRFNLVADKWGNVRRPEVDTADAATALCIEMQREAALA